MSVEANKDLVRRYVGTWGQEDADADDWAVLEGIWTPDCRLRFGSLEIAGMKAFKELYASFFEAFPDLTGQVEDMVGEGDKVVARFSWTGTHRGEFAGIPATDKRVKGLGLGIYRCGDGKIAEAWVVDDQLGLMQQLGAFPSGG